MTLPFDHTHHLDLGMSRSESEIALSQEWGGRLIMNENDGSHPFMTMILTCVTMVRWADVPDSDRGYFRRRRAVEISSCTSVCSLFGERGSPPYCMVVCHVSWIRQLHSEYSFHLKRKSSFVKEKTQLNKIVFDNYFYILLYCPHNDSSVCLVSMEFIWFAQDAVLDCIVVPVASNNIHR